MSTNVLLMDGRQLIPRWHTSRKSMELQFPSFAKKNNNQINLEDVYTQEARFNWRNEKTILTATEVNSSLFIRQMYDDSDYKESLCFLLSNFEKLPKGTADFVSPTLKKVDKSATYSTSPLVVQGIIKKLKYILKTFPEDSMTWVDLAFYYAILGMDEKTDKCFKVAYSLCNDNSFVVRSYARYLVHNDCADKALWVLNKTADAKSNPLIASAAIAIGTSFDIKSVNISVGKKILENFSGHVAFKSDLAACIGTLELNNGNVKKAKKYFSDAFLSPSENVISQYNWLYHKYGFEISNSLVKDQTSIESSVNDFYVQGDFYNCREKLLELHNFQPFSDGPIADAGYMSLVGLNDPSFVIKLSENRIPKTHMSFTELNNLVVAKLLENRIEDAELEFRLLARKTHDSDPETRGVLLATTGLYFFKRGYIDESIKFYQESIDFFDRIKSNRSKVLAEHYFSKIVQDLNPKLFKQLRVSVDEYAKKHKLKELLVI